MKRRAVAWGITGSGDKMPETVRVMMRVREEYREKVDIKVFLSKAGRLVAKLYGVIEDLEKSFGRFWVEADANTPLLAGHLQLRRFDFLLIAPATANTVAKISLGITDSLLSNAAIMALKAYPTPVPVYIMPSDYEEGVTVTRLPSGRKMKLRVRREDAEHVRRLARMEGIFLLKEPKEIPSIFAKHFGKPKGAR